MNNNNSKPPSGWFYAVLNNWGVCIQIPRLIYYSNYCVTLGGIQVTNVSIPTGSYHKLGLYTYGYPGDGRPDVFLEGLNQGLQLGNGFAGGAVEKVGRVLYPIDNIFNHFTHRAQHFVDPIHGYCIQLTGMITQSSAIRARLKHAGYPARDPYPG